MKSLRTRLMMSFTALLAAALLMFGVIIWLLAREAMSRDVDDFLRGKAMLLGRLRPPTRLDFEPLFDNSEGPGQLLCTLVESTFKALTSADHSRQSPIYVRNLKDAIASLVLKAILHRFPLLTLRSRSARNRC